MAVALIQVPNPAQMGYGLGKAMQYGVEYEVKDNLQIELNCGDELKLAKIIVAFQGKILEVNTVKNVRVDKPRH